MVMLTKMLVLTKCKKFYGHCYTDYSFSIINKLVLFITKKIILCPRPILWWTIIILSYYGKIAYASASCVSCHVVNHATLVNIVFVYV